MKFSNLPFLIVDLDCSFFVFLTELFKLFFHVGFLVFRFMILTLLYGFVLCFSHFLKGLLLFLKSLKLFFQMFEFVLFLYNFTYIVFML